MKGTYGVTFVNEGGKWLAAMDSWNVDLTEPAVKMAGKIIGNGAPLFCPPDQEACLVINKAIQQ